MKPYASGKGWELYLGDALEWLSELEAESVDAVWTDPPYSINTKSDGTGKLNPWADYCNSALWYAVWIDRVRRALRPNGAAWCSLNWRSQVPFQKAACDLRWPIESMLVWHKDWIGPGGTSGLRPSYEMVALWLRERGRVHDRGLADVQTFPWSSVKPTGHPAEKPVALVEWCLRAVLHGGERVVCDPFCGSGTTGAAALGMGHRFLGCEMDEAWCSVAARRLEQAEHDGQQVGMFGPPPP